MDLYPWRFDSIATFAYFYLIRRHMFLKELVLRLNRTL
jgi:hypothetical protein